MRRDASSNRKEGINNYLKNKKAIIIIIIIIRIRIRIITIIRIIIILLIIIRSTYMYARTYMSVNI